MSKLIYVDKLKRDILALQDCYNGFSDTYDKACIIGVIEEQPTIEERKTGEWINITNDESLDEEYECSVCGYELFYSNPTNYCPNCGARMERDYENKGDDD